MWDDGIQGPDVFGAGGECIQETSNDGLKTSGLFGLVSDHRSSVMAPSYVPLVNMSDMLAVWLWSVSV